MLTESTALTLPTLLESMTTIFTSLMSWTGTVLSTIAGNPILLVFTVGSFSLIAIGIVKRLMSI